MWLPTGRLHQLLERGAAGPLQQIEHLGRFAATLGGGSPLADLCALLGVRALPPVEFRRRVLRREWLFGTEVVTALLTLTPGGL